MPEQIKTALIIPDYNEQARVCSVVEAGLACDDVDEVIVVNDGSTDCTGDILLGYGQSITTVTHAKNQGKGQSVQSGIEAAKLTGSSRVVLLDADLTGISASHITDLISPIERDGALMTIGYLGLRKAVVKKYLLKQWGALSGQRAFELSIWSLLDEQDKDGFNIEAALNARLRKANLHHRIARVALEGVGHVGKHDKYGNWPTALRAYWGTYANALKTYARIEQQG